MTSSIGEILPEDVKAGDYIRMTRDVKVDRVTEVAHFPAVVADDGVIYSLRKTKVNLLVKPVPDLPTEAESVIRIAKGPVSSTWMLSHGGRWLGASGFEKTPQSLKEFIEKAQFTYEVIA